MSLLSPNLEAFLAVVRHCTMHGAAKELGITQTGVTQRIRSLESSLSTTLFLRSRHGMRLTAEGEALLRYCQAARDLEGQTLSRIEGAGRDAEVRVVMTGPTSIIESRVVPQCVPVLRAFPRLLLSFNVVDLENRCNDLRSGAAQLAIVPREQVEKEMDSKLLKPERYLLVGSHRWRERPLEAIVREERIIDFDATDRTSHAYLRKYGLLKEARAERLFVNNNPALLQLFEQGLGYGVLTAEVAAPHLESGRIIPLHPSGSYLNELALAWYPRPEMPEYFRALMKAVR